VGDDDSGRTPRGQRTWSQGYEIRSKWRGQCCKLIQLSRRRGLSHVQTGDVLMQQERHGTVLYPLEFVRRLPRAAPWELSPLLLLLRGEHSDAQAEIERIERWYSELNGSEERKRALAGNLQSKIPRNFWSGLSELMASRVFSERGWGSTYEPNVGKATPDFLVRLPDGSRFVAEILTAFQDAGDQRREADLYYVASALNQVKHRIGVFIDSAYLPPQRPSLAPLCARVQAWLDLLLTGRSRKSSLRVPRIGIRLTALKPRESPSPIVQGIMGVGGKIMTHESVRAAILRKVRKYRAVKDLGLSLVLFVWEGDWMKVTPTSLQWALFGQAQASGIRGRAGIDWKWGHAPGGVFGFGHDGTRPPPNTRISAVAYCTRIWQDGKVHARLELYHHPYAAHPLPAYVFAGIPQCLPVSASADEATLRWDREHEHLGIWLR
jgi:hypothetical protein